MLKTKIRMLTLKFIYSAEDRVRMDELSRSVALEILDSRNAVESGTLKMDNHQKPKTVEATFGMHTILRLNDAFALVEDKVRASEDVVLTTISDSHEDLITITHRNALKPKALEVAP